MDPIQRVIARARRRWWWTASLAWFSWLAAGGFAVAIALVMMDDLLSIRVPIWAYIVVAVLPVVLAPAIAWLRRPGPQQTAELIDHRLGLKDRISTAAYLSRCSAEDPFARQVIADAAKAADRATLRDAFTCRLGRTWAYLPVLGVTLLLLAMLVPGDLDLLGLNRQRQQTQQAAAQANEAKKKIIQARAKLNQLDNRKDHPRPADEQQIMSQLASLTKQDLSTPQAKRDAAARISNLSNQLDQMKDQKHTQFQSLKNALTQLDPGSQGPADKLAAALRRGDFKAAQQAIEQMKQQVQNGNLSAQQKKQMQQQLNQMAKQLKQMAQQAKQQQQQAQQQIKKALQNQGLSKQQIQQLQKQGFNQQAVQKAVQQALQQQGMSGQQARQQAQRVAQQLQQQQQQAQAQGQNSSMLKGLGQSFGQMASTTSGQSQNKQTRQKRAGQGKGQQPSQFGQGAWSAQQQMNQIARMQQQLQQMGIAQSQMQQAMRQMTGAGGGQYKQKGKGTGMGMNRMAKGKGGVKAGTGQGGNPLGQLEQPINSPGPSKADLQQGKGRVIASWMSDGKAVAGAPKVNFDKAITDAQNQAAQAVTQDRVPRQYHRAIHDYFNQLPASAQKAQQPPAAPH